MHHYIPFFPSNQPAIAFLPLSEVKMGLSGKIYGAKLRFFPFFSGQKEVQYRQKERSRAT